MISFVAISLIGVLVAVVISTLALRHDPLGELHDAGGVRWGFLLANGAFWFFAVTGIPYFIAVVVIVARYAERRRERHTTI